MARSEAIRAHAADIASSPVLYAVSPPVAGSHGARGRGRVAGRAVRYTASGRAARCAVAPPAGRARACRASSRPSVGSNDVNGAALRRLPSEFMSPLSGVASAFGTECGRCGSSAAARALRRAAATAPRLLPRRSRRRAAVQARFAALRLAFFESGDAAAARAAPAPRHAPRGCARAAAPGQGALFRSSPPEFAIFCQPPLAAARRSPAAMDKLRHLRRQMVQTTLQAVRAASPAVARPRPFRAQHRRVAPPASPLPRCTG